MNSGRLSKLFEISKVYTIRSNRYVGIRTFKFVAKISNRYVGIRTFKFVAKAQFLKLLLLLLFGSDTQGYTALHYACMNGSQELTKSLLTKGRANPTIR